jgi:hypothetical protein
MMMPEWIQGNRFTHILIGKIDNFCGDFCEKTDRDLQLFDDYSATDGYKAVVDAFSKKKTQVNSGYSFLFFK